MPIEVYKGNSKTVIFIIKDQNEAIVDLTGGNLFFVVKLEVGISGETVFKKETESTGLSISNATGGECTLKLIPGDTKGLIAKEYQYELLVELPDGGGFDRYTVEIDTLVVNEVLISIGL